MKKWQDGCPTFTPVQISLNTAKNARVNDGSFPLGHCRQLVGISW